MDDYTRAPIEKDLKTRYLLNIPTWYRQHSSQFGPIYHDLQSWRGIIYIVKHDWYDISVSLR